MTAHEGRPGVRWALVAAVALLVAAVELALSIHAYAHPEATAMRWYPDEATAARGYPDATASTRPATARSDVPPPSCSIGAWVKLHINQSTPKSDPCCGWDGDAVSHATCARVRDKSDISAIPGRLIPTGGHGCSCSSERVASILQWEWVPTHCTFPSWDATEFCAVLGSRLLTFVGDSTMQQFSSAVMNLLLRAVCASQVSFVLSTR